MKWKRLQIEAKIGAIFSIFIFFLFNRRQCISSISYPSVQYTHQNPSSSVLWSTKHQSWSVVYAPYTIIQWPTRSHCIETARSNHHIHLSTVQHSTAQQSTDDGLNNVLPLQYRESWMILVVVRAYRLCWTILCVTYSHQLAPFLYCSIMLWICALNKMKTAVISALPVLTEQFKSNDRPTNRPTERIKWICTNERGKKIKRNKNTNFYNTTPQSVYCTTWERNGMKWTLNIFDVVVANCCFSAKWWWKPSRYVKWNLNNPQKYFVRSSTQCESEHWTCSLVVCGYSFLVSPSSIWWNPRWWTKYLLYDSIIPKWHWMILARQFPYQ